MLLLSSRSNMQCCVHSLAGRQVLRRRASYDMSLSPGEYTLLWALNRIWQKSKKGFASKTCGRGLLSRTLVVRLSPRETPCPRNPESHAR